MSLSRARRPERDGAREKKVKNCYPPVGRFFLIMITTMTIVSCVRVFRLSLPRRRDFDRAPLFRVTRPRDL